jgi:elongation factor G
MPEDTASGAPNGSRSREEGARTIALMGPYTSGKTSLLESLAAATGAVPRKGSVTQGHSLGDAAPEARAHRMSIELNVATLSNNGEKLTVLDCPGSIEFLQESLSVLPGIDAAVLVAEPEPAKVLQLTPYLKRLADMNIPTFIFVNKIELAQGSIGALLEALQSISSRPLILRQMPVWEKDIVTGFVDLASERAYVYREHAPSEIVPLKGPLADKEKAERFHMLEQLADYDDHLMEELVADIDPPRDEIFADLAREVAEGLIVPVLLGSAEQDHGIRRLLKALRHDVPGPAATARRLGVSSQNGEAVLRVVKSVHTPHGGKLSLARVLSGHIKDGATVSAGGGRSGRVGGLFQLMGAAQIKIGEAGPGETVALGRLEPIVTGDVLATEKAAPPSLGRPELLRPVYGLAVAVGDAREDVKLTTGLAKLAEEDLSIRYEQNADTHELVLWGQGEIHLRVAAEKLAGRYGLHISTRTPKVPYKEAIRKGITQRGRYKRQTGGHGQFGDVVLEIEPLPRGAGILFEERISGGVVPRQYFTAVEAGVRDYLTAGPLGFPVVDVKVALIDGSYHTVDSSEMAFRTAGRIGMSEGLPHCGPVLLEPIMVVAIDVPGEATARVNAIVSGRRGQILGFDACEGWPGWDRVRAELPQAELQGLIVELRSASQGVARLIFDFDHLAELTGKLADEAMARAKAA